MIRLFFIGLFLFLFLVVSILIFPVLAIVGLFSKEKKDKAAYAIVVWAFRVILLMSGAKVEVKGRENIPTDTAVLYVANHRSFFDIVLGYINVVPLCGFVSKKEIGKVPMLAGWMKRMHCLFLDRENIKEGMKTILQGIEQLKGGISIFIFPEGTRGKSDDAMIDFKEGSFKMAVKAGLPIVPVAFNNTSALFEDQFPRVKKAHVSIEFGKPIIISELEKEEQKKIGKYAHDIVKSMVENNKNLL